MNPNLKRLENIKSSFEIEVKEKTFDNATMVMMRERDIEWLFAYINELQSITAHLQGKVDECGITDKEQKYREVLNFYANKDNYVANKYKSLNPNAKTIKMSDVDLDDGEKAREVLQTVKKKCTCDYKKGEGCSDNCHK